MTSNRRERKESQKVSLVNTDTYKSLLVSYFLVSVWVLNFVSVYFVFFCFTSILPRISLGGSNSISLRLRIHAGGPELFKEVLFKEKLFVEMLFKGQLLLSSARVTILSIVFNFMVFTQKAWEEIYELIHCNEVLQSFCPFYLIQLFHILNLWCSTSHFKFLGSNVDKGPDWNVLYVSKKTPNDFSRG